MDEKEESQWMLVDAEALTVKPEIERARNAWDGQQVWMLTPWRQWRRGKVLHIYNSGVVHVLVYQRGTHGLPFAFDIEYVSTLLKLVDEEGGGL